VFENLIETHNHMKLESCLFRSLSSPFLDKLLEGG
jgi:hypothetical protein